jgi:hypothetical protein
MSDVSDETDLSILTEVTIATPQLRLSGERRPVGRLPGGSTLTWAPTLGLGGGGVQAP